MKCPIPKCKGKLVNVREPTYEPLWQCDYCGVCFTNEMLYYRGVIE